MRTWLAILLFAGLTFLSLGIRPYISDTPLRLVLGNAHYIYFLLILCYSRIKVSLFLKLLFYIILIGHCTLDLLVFFETKLLDDVFIIGINLVYLATFYLGLIILFKRLGSAFYNKKKTDWLVGFPVGLITFLIPIFMFLGRVQPKFDALLILLSMFFSLFYTLGVNVPLKTKNYVILLFGLLLCYVTLILAIYVFQINPFDCGEILMKGLFIIAFYCILEAAYQISDTIILSRAKT